MKTTFLNDNSEKNLKQIGQSHLESRTDDFKTYMGAEDPHAEDMEDLPPFNEYGLCFDAVEHEETGAINFYRYQLSTGGPGDELRFHPDGSIEYVHLDWFSGVGFDVTGEEWAQWLKEYFDEIGMMTWEPVEV